jgi:hypothetical protein
MILGPPDAPANGDDVIASDRRRFSVYTAAYRQRKRWAGLCIEHGCWEPAVTKIHCAAHRDVHTAKARIYRAKRKELR